MWGQAKARDTHKQLRGLQNVARRSGMCKRYLQEFQGDIGNTRFLCTCYQMLIAGTREKTNSANLQSGNVTIPRLIASVEYSKSYKPFDAFHGVGACKVHVMKPLGNFFCCSGKIDARDLGVTELTRISSLHSRWFCKRTGPVSVRLPRLLVR